MDETLTPTWYKSSSSTYMESRRHEVPCPTLHRRSLCKGPGLSLKDPFFGLLLLVLVTQWQAIPTTLEKKVGLAARAFFGGFATF